MSGQVAKSNPNGEQIGAPVRLVPGGSKDGNTLEVAIADAAFPINLKLHVKFKNSDAREQTFDFTFPAYSKEP